MRNTHRSCANHHVFVQSLEDGEINIGECFPQEKRSVAVYAIVLTENPIVLGHRVDLVVFRLEIEIGDPGGLFSGD